MYFFFLLFLVPHVRLLPFTYLHPHFPFPPFFPFPFSFTFFPPEVPPWECYRSHSLLSAVSHLHDGTGKLWKTCADTVSHFTESVPSLQSLKKWPPARLFNMQAGDQRSPIQVLTQRQVAWLGWLPVARHLPHTERKFIKYSYDYNFLNQIHVI